MERQRTGKVIAIIALVIAILGLSIGYAAFTTTLNISNVSGTVESSTWRVEFASLNDADLQTLSISNAFHKKGTASMSGVPSIGTLTVSNINLAVAAPGDEAYYFFKIVNHGTYNARSDGITVGNTGSLSSTDQAWVNTNASFKVEYKNGSSWQEITSSTSLSLAKGETLYVRVSLKFNGSATSVPATAITFPSKKVTIPFVVAE